MSETQTQFPCVPEFAFRSFTTLLSNPAYSQLLAELADKSGDQKKKFNWRFYAGTLPIAVVGAGAGQIAFEIAHQEIFGTPASPMASRIANSASFVLFGGLGSLVTGAYKYFKVLRAIRKPTMVIDAYHKKSPFFAPIPENVRTAVKKLEEINKTLPMPKP